MTLENITPQAIAKVERALQNALAELKITVSKAAHGDIAIKDAADRINRIGAEIEKAIYPEEHEGKQ